MQHMLNFMNCFSSIHDIEIMSISHHYYLYFFDTENLT